VGDDVAAKCISNLQNKAALDTQKGTNLGLKCARMRLAAGLRLDPLEGEGREGRVTIRPSFPGHVLFFWPLSGTKKARQFSIQERKGILFVQYNFKHLSCRDFYTYLRSQPKLLKAIRSSDKYTWSEPLAQSSSSLTVPESQDEAGD